MYRSNERGAAIVLAIFMMLMVTALGGAMVSVARTETLSSGSYTSMSQARYAAESGVAAASNYLLSNAYAAVMPGTGGDPMANYNIAVSPVTRNGNPVVLSSDPAVASNYPIAAVVTAFQTATTGNLQVGGAATYSARARLLRMRQIVDGISGQTITLQTWEITGNGGRATGEIAGVAQVSAVIERGTRAVFNYAAFATANGCNALALTGNTYTNSYDSSVAVPAGSTPALSASGGHVGTNGNLGQTGNAVVNGTLSTPMSGVGACTANNVTAATIGPNAQVTDGLVQLSQPIDFPTPPAPNPLPPTINQSISGMGCPLGYVGTCAVGGGQTTFTPVGSVPVLLGDLSLSGNAVVVLKAGTYHMNSLTISGNSKIIVDSSSGGPVKIVLAGQGGGQDVLSITGNGISNTTWDPNMLRIEYAGTKTFKLAGNGDTASILYAPNAHAAFSGNGDFYGTVIMRTINSVGNAGIHYDRRLQRSTITAANPVMTSFSWHTF